MAGLTNLCAPSRAYLVVSLALLAAMYYQNMNNVNVYCLGTYECHVSNVTTIFIIKLLYVLFWTWILNLICESVSPNIAWFILLVPILLFFILLTTMFFM